MKGLSNPTKKMRIKLRPMFVVLLGFLAVLLVGAFVVAMPISNTDGKWLDFNLAIFRSMNGICGTGLVVKSTALSLTVFGQVVLLLLIQFGGLGFMTIATLIYIIIRKKITLKDRIALQEALGQDEIKGVVLLVRNIIIMTGIVELAGAILLAPFFCMRNGAIGLWQALFNSVSAFCNAGFDIMDTPENQYTSLMGYNTNYGVMLIIGLIAILGALGFPVVNDILKCKFRAKRYKFHTKVVLVMTAILMIGGSISLFISEFDSAAFANLNIGEKIANSIFQAISASSTVGFSAVDQTKLSTTGKTISCILMFIGASPCSTGGGIKTTTFAALVLMGVAGLRGKEEIVVGMHSITIKNGLRAVSVVLVAAVLILGGVLTISAANPSIPVGHILFDTITAFTTSGLSTGITTLIEPTVNIPSLYVLELVMFIGRLGPLSIGLMFVKQDRTGLKFPPANLMIG